MLCYATTEPRFGIFHIGSFNARQNGIRLDLLRRHSGSSARRRWAARATPKAPAAPELHETPIPMDQVREIADMEPTPLLLQQMRTFVGAAHRLSHAFSQLAWKLPIGP
ncbi:hypothetical protein PHYSODRAFT_328467 [Phytophthora sojae]|uniref:Uncharacterized protein n=1 Tax=Phytophthora sojae (strain P6497) TaxID=1094619 RepID=G4Z6S9_PHYSP|nr:hypothetical protein PHYSODRAFT_328467 [Phytophthora sojae]EGZ20345.1 hypothetical protein PHYSODRAFT_328467 [Phytophthora sojae]|eukprot:XP_009523062.1 hypothetical protein PHYSODRAFT_328467 [Phytophthora sojae]